MSDELQAACERLLAHEKWKKNGGHPPYGQGTQPMKITRDWQAVVAAYLREHPADDAQPVTEEWLRAVGFLPNDDHGSPTFSKFIWEKGQHEVVGFDNDPAMQIVWDWRDSSLWMETYSGGGDTLCLLELNNPTPTTRGDVRRLSKALGVELKEQSQ